MNNIPNKKKIRRERIPLPFENKKLDIVEWLYERRVGLLSMAVVYLLIAIFVVSSRISLGGMNTQDTMYIDLIEELEDELEKQQQEELERRRFEQEFEDVRNLESNENSQLNADLKDAAGNQASQIYEEAEKVQARMRANKESYLEGLREQQQIENSSRSDDSGKDEEKVERKYEGNVTVSFSLEGRSAAYLHSPAYQCESGGSVTVSITVDPSGKVIAASIDRSSSTTDVCLREMAVNAARMSRFNVDQSAPDKQQGTISYIFVAQ